MNRGFIEGHETRSVSYQDLSESFRLGLRGLDCIYDTQVMEPFSSRETQRTNKTQFICEIIKSYMKNPGQDLTHLVLKTWLIKTFLPPYSRPLDAISAPA
jgi:hypothetical protein